MPITVYSLGMRHLDTARLLGDTDNKRKEGWGVFRHEKEAIVHSVKERDGHSVRQPK